MFKTSTHGYVYVNITIPVAPFVRPLCVALFPPWSPPPLDPPGPDIALPPEPLIPNAEPLPPVLPVVFTALPPEAYRLYRQRHQYLHQAS